MGNLGYRQVTLSDKFHCTTVAEADQHCAGSVGLHVNLLDVSGLTETAKIKISVDGSERFSSMSPRRHKRFDVISLSSSAPRKRPLCA